MKKFTFYHPISIRYSDLDLQGHVNNVVYLTYVESARLGYYQATGIWRPDSDKLTGMVVAHNDIDYLSPITLEQKIKVGIGLVGIGKKSLTLAFQIESQLEKSVFARGTSVMVAYDNSAQKSIPFPLEWREKILKFEEQNGAL
ncbi:MAG: acyl-CoA thioesterase [Brevefilum sp.]